MIRSTDPRVVLLCGLGFGDEGKGTTVEYLTEHLGAHTVVRYNGGPQAAHTVVEKDRHHVFAQFGSGTLLGAKTHLSRFMLVCPFRLRAEAEALVSIGVDRPLDLVSIDKESPVVTPLHKLACQIRELVREIKHGSCGVGVWETTRYARQFPALAPRIGDLSSTTRMVDKLDVLRRVLVADLREVVAEAAGTERYAAAEQSLKELEGLDLPALSRRYRDSRGRSDLGKFSVVGSDYLGGKLRSGTTIFEGSQGVLLDETFGFHPHTTGSTTTYANAEDLLADLGFGGQRHRVGVLRSYMTRHGGGPMPTEITDPPVAEKHNKFGQWMGGFRTGHLDFVLLRYAIQVLGGVDVLSVTHADQWDLFGAACTAYQQPSPAGHLFRLNGALIRGTAYPDLGYQEALGRAVAASIPRLQKATDLGSFIEDQLNASVSVLSAGPTRQDKRCFTAF